MRRLLFLSSLLAVLVQPGQLSLSQEVTKVLLPESVEKYYRVLKKSPSRNYLYDRFVEAWLETEPLSKLPAFFVQNASAEEATAADKMLAGFYFSRRGDIEAALDYFEKALALSPEESDARLERAKLFARELDFEKALVELDAALAIDELDPKTELELGKLKGRYLARSGDSEKAIEVWKNLLTTHPDDLYLHEDVVESLASEGLLEESVNSAKELVEKTEDSYDKLLRQFRVAELHVLGENPASAVEVYEEALPKTGAGTWLEREILARVEAIYRRSDEIDVLTEWITGLAEENPQRLELARFQADLAADNDETDRAIEIYETILEKSPGDRSVQDSYVDILAKTGQTDEAIAQQKTIIEQNSEDATARLRLAELYAAAKKMKEAGGAVMEAFELSDKAEIEYLRAVKFLEKFKQFSLAEHLLETGRTAHPDSEEIPETKGALLLRQEKTEDAITFISKLAESASIDQLIRLASSLARENFANEALSLLRSRETDFAEEFLFVEALIQLLVRTEKREDLESLTLSHLALANTPEELERALTLATGSFPKSDDRLSLLEKLEKKENPLPVEISLTAQLLSREGELERATALLDRAIEKFEGEDRVLLLRQESLIYIRDKDWEKAARVAETLYTDPGGKTSRNVKELVAVLELAGREEDSLPLIAEWKTLSPGSVIPWMREADMLYTLGRGDEAIASLRKASSQFPDAVELQLKLAQLHNDLDDPAEAARIYWDLYEETEEATIRLRRVTDLHELADEAGTVSELVEEFQRRKQSNRTSSDPVLALAEIYKLESDYAEQEEELKEASRLNPDDLALLHQIADVQLKQDEWEESIVTLETAARTDTTPRSKQRVAKIEIEFGDPQKGYQQLTDLAQELAGADQSLAMLVEEIADIMIGNGDYEIATNYLAQYFGTFPDNYRLRYLQAVAFEEASLYGKAVESFSELINWSDEMESPFIALLNEDEKEIVDKYRESLRNYHERIPTEIAGYYQITAKQREAYSYLTQNQGPVYSGVQSLSERVAIPPLELESLQKFAILHLASIRNDNPGEAIEKKIADSFQSVGDVATELLLVSDFNTEYGKSPISVEVLREQADDLAVQLLWLQNTLYFSPGPEFHSADYLNCYEIVKEKYPERAVLAAYVGGHYLNDTAFEKQQEESLEYLQTIDPSTPQEFEAIAAAVGILPYNQRPSPILKSEELTPLIDPIEKWAFSASEEDFFSSNLRPRFQASLFNEYAATQQYEKLNESFSKLIKIADDGEKIPSTSAAAMYALYGTRYSPVGSFPGTLVAFLNSNNPNAQYAPRYELTEEDSLALLDLATDSRLKFLLTARTADDEEVKKQIAEQSIREGGPSTDELLLFAWWAGEKSEFDTMSGFLQEARKRAEKPEMKSAIDGLLAFAATNGSGHSEETLKAGRDGMKRLLATNIDPNYTSQLLPKLQQLGLTNEARKLAATPRGRQSVAAQVVRGSSKAAHQKIQELLAAGKKDAALKLAIREARTIGREAAKQTHGNWRNNFWELRRAITEGGIAPDTIKGVKVINGESSTSRLYQTGIAAELFEVPTEAKRQYEKILEIDPTHVAARSRMIWIEGESQGVDGAKKYFAEVPTKDLNELLQKITEQMYGIGYDNPEARATYSAIAAAFGKLSSIPENANFPELHWVKTMYQQMAQGRDWGSVEMAFIHDLSPELPDRYRGNSDEENEEVEKLRDETLTELFETGKKFACLRRAIFTEESAYDIQRGGDPEKWVEEARKLVAANSEESGQNHLHFETSGSYQNVCHPLYTPEEFLIREAWKRNDPEEAAKIVDGADRSYSDVLKQFRDLYFEPIENFGTSATGLKSSNPGSGLRSSIPYIYHVIWAVADREIPYETAISLLKSEAERSGNISQTQFGWLRTFAHSIGKSSEYPRHVEFCRDLRKIWLGDDLEKIRESVAAAYKAGGGQLGWNAPETGFARYCMAALAADETYLFPAAEILRESGFELERFIDQNWKYRTGDYFTIDRYLSKFFSVAPWFGEVKNIDFLESAAFDNTGSLFGEFIKETKDDLKKETLASALEGKPDCFFKEFAIALVNNKGSTRADEPLGIVGKYLDEFEALAPESRRKWIDLFGQLGIGLAMSLPVNGADDSASLASRWLIEQGAKTLEAEITEFLGANQVSDLKTDPRQFESRLTSLLRRTIANDHLRAADIFMHGWDLITKEQRGAGWRGTNSSNGWPVGSEILDNFLEANDAGLADLAFYVEVQRRDKKGEVPHSGWNYDMKLSARIRKAVDRSGGVNNLAESVPAMLTELHEEIGNDESGHADILSLPFHDFIDKLPRQHRLKAILAADEVAKADVPESGLAENLAMTGRFFMAEAPDEKVNAKERKEVPDPDIWKPFALEQLSDESKTGSFRVPLANLYCFYGDPNGDSEIGMLTGHILAEAFEEDNAFNGYNVVHCLREFNPLQDQPGWDKTANRILAGWWKKNRHNDESRYSGRAFDPVSHAVLSAVELAVRTGKPDAVEKFRKVFASTIYGSLYTELPLLLIEFGYGDEARDLIQNHSDNYDASKYEDQSRYYQVRFTPDVSGKVEAFLAATDDPELASFAQVFLYSAPDLPARELPDGWVGRTPRLVSAAREFKEVEWTDEKMLRRTLQQLLIEPQTTNVVPGHIKREAGRIDPIDVIGSNNATEIQYGMRITSANCWIEAMRGNLEPFENTWEKIASAAGSSYYRNEAREELARFFWDTLRRRALIMKPEEIANVLPVCERILADYDQSSTHFTGHDSLAVMWVLSHSIAGTGEAAEQFLSDLPEPARNELKAGMNGHHAVLLPILLQGVKAKAPMGINLPAIRQRAVIDYFGNSLIQDGFTKSQKLKETLFDEIVKKQILTKPELFEIADQAHAAWPRNGWAAFELSRLAKSDKNTELCLKWGEKAVEEFGEKTPVTRRIDAVIYHAENLADAGKTAEAAAMLKKLPRDPNPKEQPAHVRRLQELKAKI